jgi:hypothetical protein
VPDSEQAIGQHGERPDARQAGKGIKKRWIVAWLIIAYVLGFDTGMSVQKKMTAKVISMQSATIRLCSRYMKEQKGLGPMFFNTHRPKPSNTI